jgi:hypothetical protein
MTRFRLVAVAIIVLASQGAIVGATPFDTNDTVLAVTENYWPWGDAENTRYQLWLSEGMLAGHSGVITSIRHFVADAADKVGLASWALDVYLSTTSVTAGGLSAVSPDANHGADKTLVFSGSVSLTSLVLTLDVLDIFSYGGSGNLLIDYVFSSFTGIGAFYDGPTWEAVPSNGDLLRVTNHLGEGNTVYDWGADRTALEFEPVPEPATLLLLGSGLCATARRRRRRG